MKIAQILCVMSLPASISLPHGGVLLCYTNAYGKDYCIAMANTVHGALHIWQYIENAAEPAILHRTLVMQLISCLCMLYSPMIVIIKTMPMHAVAYNWCTWCYRHLCCCH